MPTLGEVSPNTPNARLRAARTAAGLSQERLAERVNIEVEHATGTPGALEGATVSRMERGEIRRPRQRTVDALCRVLGASAADLGFEASAVDLDAIAHAADKPWRVGSEALDAVATILAGTRRLEDVTGSAAVAPTIDHQLRLIHTFARQANSAHRHQAVTLAAEISTYRGWLAIDMEDWPTATRSLNDATALAVESRAQSLLVEAIGFQSYAALKQDQKVAALSLRRAAQPLARTPVERAVACLHLARTLAIAGNIPASDRALADADTAIEQAEGTPRDDHHYYVTDPWLLIQRGLVHAYAGRRQHAARDIETGLAGIPEDWSRSSWGRRYATVLAEVS